jgi:hypothetical protein
LIFLQVIGFVSGNENKILAVRKLINEKYPEMLVWGCSAHYLNLLKNEICPSTLVSHIVKVNKYFRNHCSAQSKLLELGGKIPQLPNETRWQSLYACVSTYCHNYEKYLKIARDIVTEKSTSDIQAIFQKLNDMNIYTNTLFFQKQMVVVELALNTV